MDSASAVMATEVGLCSSCASRRQMKFLGEICFIFSEDWKVFVLKIAARRNSLCQTPNCGSLRTALRRRSVRVYQSL